MLRNVVTTYAARFAAVLSTFILVPVVAGAVGIDAFGLYATVAAMGILFSQDLGMASATIKFVAHAKALGDKPRLREISSASTWYFITIALAVSICLSIAFAFIIPSIAIPPDVNVVALVVLAIANAFFGMALSSHRQLLTGAGRLDLVNGIQIGQAAARIALTVLVLTWVPNIVAVAAIDFGTTLVAGLITWIVRRRLAPETVARLRDFNWRTLREVFKFSADLLIMTISAVVVLQSGTVLAALLLPLGAVAVYAAANRAFLLVREAANSLTLGLLPTATVRAAAGEHGANARLYSDGTRIANAIMIILLVPVVVFAYQFLEWWVGATLASGFVAAQILVLSLLANNNHLVAIPILTGMGSIRPYAILHAIWAISGIILGVFLAPVLGVIGIAIALASPILLLEPIYIAIAVRKLQLSMTQFVTTAVLRPYGVGLIPASLLVAVAATVPMDLTSAIVASLIWVFVMATADWFLVLRSEERNHLARLLRRRSPGGTNP